MRENIRVFFSGSGYILHSIIVSSYTQSPASNVTSFTFLAENSSHVYRYHIFLIHSSLVRHQCLALTQILLTMLQSTLMCKSLIHSIRKVQMGYVIDMVFLFKKLHMKYREGRVLYHCIKVVRGSPLLSVKAPLLISPSIQKRYVLGGSKVQQ